MFVLFLEDFCIRLPLSAFVIQSCLIGADLLIVVLVLGASITSDHVLSLFLQSWFYGRQIVHIISFLGPSFCSTLSYFQLGEYLDTSFQEKP